MPHWISDAGVAAIFYALTYVALLRILAYPRNWLAPPIAGLLVAGFLAVLTVVYTAATPSGFSFWLALACAGLLSGVGACIAAPALGFKPGAAGPFMRWLAVRSGFAGLLVAGAGALVAIGLKAHVLQGVAFAAVVLELTWTLTCVHAWRQRVDVRLEDADVAVLQAHAGADVRRFADTHALYALHPDGRGGFAWRGCTQDTHPCAFNHHTLALGLNAAPCCRAHLRSMCAAIVSGIRRCGHTCWLDGGTLLGAVRGQDLLAWEDDIDIAVLLNDDSSWAHFAADVTALCQQLGFHLARFDAQGFLTVSFDRPRPWPVSLQRNRMRGDLRVDLVAYQPCRVGRDDYLCRASPKGLLPRIAALRTADSRALDEAYGVPASWVLPTTTVSFAGSSLPAPARAEAYLTQMYGDWHQVRYLYMDADAASRRAHLDCV